MDATRDDFDRLTAAMQGMTGTLGRITNAVDNDRASASKTLRQQMGEFAKNSSKNARQFEGTVFKTEENLRLLTGTLRDTAQNLRRMIGGVFGGAIIGLVLQRGTDMARTFSDLNEAGQNFGGSMLKMHQAAAAAGLPLSDFAELVKKNGEAIAKMGTSDFAALSLNVRNLTAKSGLYGYTIDQLNDQLGEYATTAAMYGTANLLHTRLSTERFADLAANTSALAEVTKKSREEITKLANEAMRGALALGGMMSLPNELRESTHKTLANVTAVFAAQQGEAGRMLSKFVADTFGTGFSALTETGKAINEAGLGELLSDMDVLADKVKMNTATQEDAAEYSNKFKRAVERNSKMLTLLAASGNQQAAQMIEAASHMKIFTAEELAQSRKNVKERAAITALFQSLEHRFGVILGAIQTGFYKGIEPFLNMFSRLIGQEGAISYFEEKAKAFGSWLGTIMTRLFTNDNMSQIEQLITSLLGVGKVAVDLLGGLGKILVFIAPGLALLSKGLLMIANGFSTAAGVVGSFGDKIFGTGKSIQKTFSGVAATLAVLFGPKLIKSFFKGVFSSRMLGQNIRANIVNVYGRNVNDGGGGFGGGGGGGGGRGRGRLRRGWAAGAERAERAGRGRLGKLAGGLGGFFGQMGRGLRNFRPHKGLLGGLMALGMLGGLGMFSGSAQASPVDDNDSAQSNAKPVPMKVTHLDNITDQNDRNRYARLLQMRAELRKGEQNDKTQAQSEDVEKQLKGFNDRYGVTVNDPHDANYVSITGHLPPGSRNGQRPGQPAGRPPAHPAKPPKKPADAKKDENGMGMLDWLSLGLGAASFIPGVGIVTGALGAGVDVLRGDYVGAGLSLASMIPVAGDAAAAGKAARFGSRLGGVARKAQLFNDVTGASMGFAGSPMSGLFGGEAEAAEPDSQTATPDEDYTQTEQDTPETKALNKILTQDETQNKVIITLLAQINQNQKEVNRLLTRLVTTR